MVAFILISSSVLFVFTVPFTWGLFWLARLHLISVRMFAVTEFIIDIFRTTYIRHRGNAVYPWMACLHNSTKGPLWWAAHHRMHHKYSDTDKDLHSPKLTGFWNSHIWFLKWKMTYDIKLVKDY
ncbi:MAG: acyl-CoA desaturase, partial [Leptospiraceae bacterium]|nr:acyl-CoA desaturase [Leptospiraceae bacterium]